MESESSVVDSGRQASRGTHVRRTDPARAEGGEEGIQVQGPMRAHPGASRALQAKERGGRQMGLGSIQEGLSGTAAISWMQNFRSENQG